MPAARPFVLPFLCLALAAGYGPQPAPDNPATTLARIQDPAVSESSGVTASRANPGAYWTHNDSGDSATVYAFDRKGTKLGSWAVPGARARDWEDIAMGPGPQSELSYLYIGDIGDNVRRRPAIFVYRVPEPVIPNGGCRGACATEPAVAIRLRYPDGPHNAEALLVHPTTGDVYVITKGQSDDPDTGVYVARRSEVDGGDVKLTHVATLNLSDSMLVALLGGITGGDISPDGRRVALCDYLRSYEAALPPGAGFDEIWKQPFTATTLPIGWQIEGICYRADGKAKILTSEGAASPIFELTAGGPG